MFRILRTHIRRWPHSLWSASTVIVLLLLVIRIAPAAAASVSVGVSSREAYVGVPIVLQLRVHDADDHVPPVAPNVDGLQIRSAGAPAISQQFQIINGRQSSSKSFTYSFRVTAEREGRYTIPEFRIVVDGRTDVTEPITISVTESETGDLLFVEVAGAKDEIYVGESLELTLRIWIKPYRDRDREVTLSEDAMWRSITGSTQWGVFRDRLLELGEQNRRPGGQEVLRDDNDGSSRSYYRYELATTVYPQRAGPINADDVRIVVNYPLEIGRRSGFGGGLFDDDFFAPFGGRRLSVTKSRPVAVKAEVAPILVKPIPTKDRPADYRGAVGRYHIATSAKPTNVRAGDPITLRIEVAGTGPLDRLQAPPLAELEELTKQFRVNDEPLAGTVDGSFKSFSTTLRPLREGVEQIPPIPFSYFDPDAKQFVTVYSDPIRVTVGPADTLSMNAIVANNPAGNRNRPDASPGPAEAPARLLPFPSNAGDPERLRNESPTFDRWGAVVPWLLVPPLLVLGLQLYQSREFAFTLGSRVRSAMRELQANVDRSVDHEQLAQSVGQFLARCLRLSASDDPDVVARAVGQLRTSGMSELAVRFERILEQCRRGGTRVIATDDAAFGQLKQETLAAAEQLQLDRARLLRRPTRNPKPTRSSMASVAFAVALSGASANAVEITPAQSVEPIGAELTVSQQSTLLQEADDSYAYAINENNADVAQQKIEQAIKKYQTLVDCGIRNSTLLTHLANAQVAHEQFEQAAENYQTALTINPTNRAARDNLRYLQQTQPDLVKLVEEESTAPRLLRPVQIGNRWLNQYVHPQTMVEILLASWTIGWAFVAMRVMKVNLPWRMLATMSFGVALLAAASYAVTLL